MTAKYRLLKYVAEAADCLSHDPAQGTCLLRHAWYTFQSEAYVKKVAEKLPDLGQRFIYMINTGNVISRGGLDLSQSTGFTVVAEKLNFHRQALHAILLCLSRFLQVPRWSEVDKSCIGRHLLRLCQYLEFWLLSIKSCERT